MPRVDVALYARLNHVWAVNSSLPPSGEPENLLVYVKRLRKQAEEFERTIKGEFRLTRAQLIEEPELVRQAKRWGP